MLAINDVLEHYSPESVQNRGKYMTRCILHDDDSPSMSIDTYQNVWFCHTCMIGGDGVELIKRKEGISDFREALRFASDNGIPEEDEQSGSDGVRVRAYGNRGRSKARGKRDNRRRGGYVPRGLRRDT